MTGKFSNQRTKKFLAELATDYTEATDLSSRSKFNFSYFSSDQPYASDFSDLLHEDLIALLQKIKDYTRHPLVYWQNQRAGGGGRKVLEIYSKFPQKSEFTHPKHVPSDAVWARFRMEGKVRLVGFIVPSNLNNQYCKEKKHIYCCNTFYVVFLDLDHKFYITKS